MGSHGFLLSQVVYNKSPIIESRAPFQLACRGLIDMYVIQDGRNHLPSICCRAVWLSVIINPCVRYQAQRVNVHQY